MTEQSKSIFDYNYFIHSAEHLSIIPFNHELGKKLLLRSNFNNAFFKLSPHFVSQRHITTCGIASAVIVLNAIYVNKNIRRPFDHDSHILLKDQNQLFGNFIWNETNLLKNEITQNFIDEDVIKGLQNNTPGLALSQLSMLLNLHGCFSEIFYANYESNEAIDKFRNVIKNVTANPDKFLIINYNINIQFPELNSGHFSPIAAYDEDEDYILLLDTWSAYSPWVWIKLEDIFKSMNTLDNGIYRGYILVE